MHGFLAAGLTLLLFAAGFPAAAGDDDCRTADHLTYISGESECLAIRTYPPQSGGTDNTGADGQSVGKTLVVVLHGDLSRGGPADYIFPIAEQAAAAGSIGVAMMRPGYSGGGRSSTGTASRNERRAQIYTADEMDEIAAAVQNLKTFYGASSVVMIGHSGGAVMTGVILGRHPGLVQRALLLSCPCDIPTWRRMRNRKPLPNAENPIEYVDRIPAGTVIRLLTGSNDSNTRPSLAAAYADKARDAGLDTVAVEIPGASHSINATVIDSPEFTTAFSALVTGR